MNSFEERVADFITREIGLEPSKGTVIVALSGGADSVALLAVLTALGFDCVAAHCNFHLRGEESDRDMRHAESVANQLHAPFRSVHFNVASRMDSTGESMEMACRELRYEWFGQLQEQYSAQAVATGHHLEDNVETMLLNMIRGTGTKGAAGISPRGERRVSPLLETSKQEIIDYLSFRGLTYVTDSSNLNHDISRNRLRNGILVTLENDFPGALSRLSRSIANLRDDAALLDSNVAVWRKKYQEGEKIYIDRLKENESQPAMILFHILKQSGFKRGQCDAMLYAPSGSRFIAGNREITVNRGFALIHDHETEPLPTLTLSNLTHPNPWFVGEIITRQEFNPVRDRGTIYLDTDKLPADAEWKVRPVQRGDRMKPFGMHGRSKLISDIFNDMKADSRTKRSAAVLTCNGEIVWLIGIKASEMFRVSHISLRILKLQCAGSTNCE